jgi:hypothetical protein
MTGPINPNDPNAQGAQAAGGASGASGSSGNVAQNPFAKIFPYATPDQVKQMMNSFINSVMTQMQQDNNQVLQALQKLQQDEQSN